MFNVQLEYLPPYCPFLSPIEACFGDLKAWIRRYYRPVDGVYPDFMEFLVMALAAISDTEDAESKAKAHYRKAGYFWEEDEQS